jgi:hypothetical protein
MNILLKTFSMIAIMIVTFLSPMYARSITGGHKILDAVIVSLCYLVGIIIVGNLMPEGTSNEPDSNFH